jgi:hypothetical protein
MLQNRIIVSLQEAVHVLDRSFCAPAPTSPRGPKANRSRPTVNLPVE